MCIEVSGFADLAMDGATGRWTGWVAVAAEQKKKKMVQQRRRITCWPHLPQAGDTWKQAFALT